MRRCANRSAAVRSSVRMKPVGKWVGGSGALWVFATARTVVYAIQDGCGFDEAAAVPGVEFDSVLVRDGWAPYRQFEQAAHQTCLAHLIPRRARGPPSIALTDGFVDTLHAAID